MTVVLDKGIDDCTVEYLWWAECLECGGLTKTDGWGCCYHCGSDIVFRVEVVNVVRCPAQHSASADAENGDESTQLTT